MIWRLRTRRRFAELAAHGRRIRRGPLSVTVYLAQHDPHCSDSDLGRPAEVGFALGRRLGTAVVRNQVRRRLRALIVDVHRTVTPWPSGAYLFGCSPAATTLSSSELRPHVEALAKAVSEATR